MPHYPRSKPGTHRASASSFVARSTKYFKLGDLAPTTGHWAICIRYKILSCQIIFICLSPLLQNAF